MVLEYHLSVLRNLVEMLSVLSPDERLRVLGAAMALLGIPATLVQIA